MTKVLIAHPGTQYSYNLAKHLFEHGMLLRFYTCFSISKSALLYKCCPNFIKRLISSRLISLPPYYLNTFPLLELVALIKLRFGMKSEDVYYSRNKRFQEKVSSRDIIEADFVIGYDTSSWIIAQRCKKLGKKFILDISIAHPKVKESIFKNLSLEYPIWAQQIEPKKNLYIQNEQHECELADLLVVPSNFVKTTYTSQGISEKKIIIIPFGTDINYFKPKVKQITGKIQFLFFGGLSARKGLPFLLEAWEQLDTSNAELIIAGFGHIPSNIILPTNVINLGQIQQKDRTIIFSKAHVFVFPSFFEGLAQVQIEAIASGLPLIGTYNSGCEDLIDNEKEGFIIKPGDLEGLIRYLSFFIKYPDQIAQMGKAARKKSEKFTWGNYGKNWIELINLESEIK